MASSGKLLPPKEPESPQPVKMIGRTILRDEFRKLVTGRILDGTYAPGSRIVESQLAREFGTSQAPVREALRDLEGMQLVESSPHRGARVRKQSVDRLLQSYPVRAALEELAGREAVKRISDEGIAALFDELKAMRISAEQDDVQGVMSHDRRFHELILEVADNQVLLETWRSLRVEAGTFVSAIFANLDLQMIAGKHEPIFDAIKARNPEAVAKQLRTHIEFFRSLVKKDPNLSAGAANGDAKTTASAV